MKNVAKDDILGRFHVHIDGHCVPQAARDAIAALPFVETPFRRDLMDDGFEAPFHFTFKTRSSVEFKRVYALCRAKLEGTGFEGYVEGECLAYDEDVAFAGAAGADLGALETRFEDLGDGAFRETEIHIAFESGCDDEAVAELKRLGFFSAFMDKPYGLAEILTLQGSMAAIKAIEAPVRAYLASRPAIRHCSVKREDIARFWLTRPDIKRAPVLTGVKVGAADLHDEPAALDS